MKKNINMELTFKNIREFKNKHEEGNQTIEERRIGLIVAQQLDVLNQLVGGEFYECDCDVCKVRKRLGIKFIPKPGKE